MMLRGGKRYEDSDQEEWETVYFAKCGILVDQPVLSWPNLEEFIENDGGPITQNATDVKSASFRSEEQEIPEVYPLDQSGTGDADIIAGQNIAYPEGLDTDDEDLTEAVERTSHLTYRVNGGTLGFDKEQAYTVKSFSMYQPEEITLWGHPFVICTPMCNAYKDT